MGKRNSISLTEEQALKIANNFLDVFETFSNNAPGYLMSYPTENEELDKELEKRNYYVTLEWIDTYPGKIKVNRHEIKSEDDKYKNNTYEIYYRGHKYVMNFYESPEICSYVEGPKYDKERYMFCSIALVDINDLDVREMDFVFDVESMKFLEIYDMSRTIYEIALDKNSGELNWKPKTIKHPKSCEKLERKLSGRTLAKTQKVI